MSRSTRLLGVRKMDIAEIERNALLQEVREELREALFQMDDDQYQRVSDAIEAMIDAKLAAALETMADRVEQALGARP